MKKVVIIGAGPMAREHIRAFCGYADAKIAGICSRTRAKAQALADEFDIAVVAENLEELYQKASPDLAVVAVNIPVAKDVLKSCIDFKVPILTEKPIALDLDQSREVQVYAHEKECPLWVGLNRRCYGATTAALDGLADDEGPRIIQVWDQQDLEVANKLGHPKSVQDNWMYANSIHLVDYMRIFGRGEIVGVDVTNAYDRKNPGLVNAVVRFSSGDVGLYTAIWNGPGPWGCIVSTPSVRWEMMPLESARYVLRGTRKAVSVPRVEIDTIYKAGFYRQGREVLDALDGAACSCACDIDLAMATTDLVGRIYMQ